MLFHAEEKTVRLGGSEIPYVVFGSGKRPLVLIPGLSLRSVRGTALPLAWMYRLFARDWRVYVFDRKADIPEGCTVRDLAEDTAQAMLQLGLGRADVIGVSQGGMIAQYLALDHPGLVRRLVLAVTLSRPNDMVRAAVDQWVRDAERGDYAAIVRDMTVRMYSEQYVRRYRWLFPLLLKTAKLNEPDRFIRLAKACLTCDTFDRLPELRCPVLVLGGQEDRIVTAEASEEIAEKLGCPIYLYEGLGHSAYEEGKGFNRRICDFLKEAPAGKAASHREETPMITGSLGAIYGELKCPSGTGPVPLVILSHGFGGELEGNRDYAEFFLSRGFATYNFDFCGGGPASRSAGTMPEMTVLTEAQDLCAVIDRFKGDPRFSALYLWGASQGGFVSAYVASQRPGDVAKAVLEFPAIVLQDDAKARANPDGSFPETSCVMGLTIGRAYNEAATSFDLYDLIGAYSGPVLLLHGDADPVVPLRYSERAAKTFPHARLVVMPGQGHGFTGTARREAQETEAAFFAGADV